MDFIPYEGGPQPPFRPFQRVILAGLTIVAVVVGAATVLARPTSARPPTTLQVNEPASAVGLPANADRDLGPGEAESEVARLPDARP